MNDHLIVYKSALRFCTNHSASLQNLRHLFEIIGGFVPESNQIDFASFTALYDQQEYDSVSDFEVLQLPHELKRDLLSALKNKNSTSQSDVLPDLPDEDDETDKVEDFKNDPLLKPSHSRLISSLQSRINTLSTKPASEGKVESSVSKVNLDVPENPVTATSVNNSASQQNRQGDAEDSFAVEKDDTPFSEHVSVQQSTSERTLSESDAQQVRWVEDLLQTKQKELSSVRSELSDERKQLHTLRLILSKEITSIDDPSAVSLLEQFNRRSEDLDRRERLIDQEKSSVEALVKESEEKLSYLQDAKKKLKSELMDIERSRHEMNQAIVSLRQKKSAVEEDVTKESKRYEQLLLQVDDAEKFYNQMNEQLQTAHEELRLSKDELLRLEQELQSREVYLSKKEKETQLRQKREREHMYSRIREAQSEYKDKLKFLQQKERALDEQRIEMHSMKSELTEVKKAFENERDELDRRESELAERFLLLERQERDLRKREKSFNDSTKRALDYVEQSKRELRKDTLLKESDIQQRMVELQEKEVGLLHKQQSFLDRSTKDSSHNDKSVKHEHHSLNRERKKLLDRSAELTKKLDALKEYSFDISSNDESSDELSFSDIDSSKSRDFSHLSSSKERRTTSRSATNELGSLNSSVLAPSPNMDNIPTPQTAPLNASSGSSKQTDFVAVEEVEALLELAEQEVAQNVDVAKQTYKQLRSLYGKLVTGDKHKVHPRLKDLYTKLSTHN